MTDNVADVVVLGGNPGGCAAAIAAARSGQRVVLLEPSKVFGGINANGVFGFDAARPPALAGIAKEVEAIIRAHYAEIGLDDPLFHRRADQVWESHVNAMAWERILRETENLTAISGAVPVGARTEGGRITEVHWLPATDVYGNVDMAAAPAHVVRARMVVDPSYEGDILEWAGVPYDIGREPRSWHEPHAGKIYTSDMIASQDGYMPHSVLPGSTGDGDGSVMAFACRLHCKWYDDPSPDAAHRIKAPPAGYDPSEFAWKPQGHGAQGEPVWFKSLYVLVNRKFLVNRMIQGNDLAGPTRAYTLAHPADRRALRQAFIDYALGYLYFIQTEGGCPQLGLADDEFQDNGNIPYQIYIRGGRRMKGRYTMTEADVNPYILGDNYRPPAKADSVAIGDWIFESHACIDRLEPGYNFPEGWLFNRVTQCPYQVPYRSLLPLGCDNLIVCGSISATHIGFSATRCEAMRIQTGIAAGVAAALSLSQGCTPAELPVRALQDEIVARGGKLTYFGDLEADHPNFAAIQWAALRGFVPQDDEWLFRPDHPTDWAETVETAVKVLGLPISVSGMHFEGIGPRNPHFRYLESLYDLGTRSDVDIFASRALGDEDPMRGILRLYPQARLIPFKPDGPVSRAAAQSFFGLVGRALTGRDIALHLPGDTPGTRAITRGDLCEILHDLDRKTMDAGLLPHESLARRGKNV